MVSSEYYIQDNSNIEDKKFEAAKSHYLNKDYQAALKIYMSMINTSISFKLYYEIGRCFYKLDDFQSAEEYFKKSISLESFKNPSYIYLGNLYYKQTDLNNAIEAWIGAYAYKPDDEALCLNLATSYFSKGMKFQSVYYYEKYLKYAKSKDQSYSTIKQSIDKCVEIGNDFYNKANRSIALKDNKTAIEYLNFAVKNSPVNFDINYLLGATYLEENDYMHALAYLKQALCIDNRSLDALQNLTSVYINIGDFTAAYCTMRRILPLVIHNQQEYLNTLNLLKDFEKTFDEQSFKAHKEWGDNYFYDNNYHLALLEYENCAIMKKDIDDEVNQRIVRLKAYLEPEKKIIDNCMAKGNAAYMEKDYINSNKFFTRVMKFAKENTPEFRTAKSRVVNV